MIRACFLMGLQPKQKKSDNIIEKRKRIIVGLIEIILLKANQRSN